MMAQCDSRPDRQLAFYFDQDGCIACRACQIACKDLHDLPVGVNYRRVVTHEGGRFPRPEVFHLSLSCNHCARPACVEACPAGAIAKRDEDGVVVLDESLCSACRACVDACPYGAVQYDEGKECAGKCDFCLDLVARGERPACVAACTMRVLSFGRFGDLTQGMAPVGHGLPDPAATGPSMRLTPHRRARGGA